MHVSGQLLTDDYCIDTNSRLCMSSTVTGHTRALCQFVRGREYDHCGNSGAAPHHCGGNWWVLKAGTNYGSCVPELKALIAVTG